MWQFEVAVTLVIALLLATTVLLLFFKKTEEQGYRAEVLPQTARIARNIWNGRTRVLFQGSSPLRFLSEREMARVGLKNEPRNPPPSKVITRDRIQLLVDFTIHQQQIAVDPLVLLGALPTTDDEDAVRKAALAIDYARRNDAIDVRIESALQQAFIKRRLEDIFVDKNIVPETLAALEMEINAWLEEEVTKPWGFIVKLKFEDIVLPPRLMQTAEEVETAVSKATAIKVKAETAGVPVSLAFILEALYDLFGNLKPKGGGKPH